ncbi:MAG: tetratricopeptide repeat protein [Deltaproteobacteria bacterium]|nr:tetratricopeptide repeat protein [Deltaproteobacteria bacterium]
MRSFVRIALLVSAALAATAPMAAAAPTPAEIETARKLFADAEKDERDSRWDQALRKLNGVAAIKETAGVRFHIGNCLEHLGRLVEALDSFQKAQSLAGDSRAVDVLQSVAPRIEQLRVRIPTLTLRVPASEQDAVVRLDGKVLERGLVGTPVGLDPGTHLIVIEFSGAAPIVKQLVLVESRPETVEFSRIAPKPAASSAPSSAAPIQDQPPESARSSPKVPVGAWISFGAGVALAAGGYFAFRHAGSVADDSEVACAQSVACDPERASVVRKYDAIALGLWSGAAAAIGTGIVLTLTSKPSSAAPTVAIQPGGLSFRGAF